MSTQFSIKPVFLSAEHAKEIEAAASAAYPNECCGILFGLDTGERRTVTQFEHAANVFGSEHERDHRFSICPRQLMEAERKAEERSELVLGFYHSHPDHPPDPSEFDRENAWPFYSYLIVSVERGRAVSIRSWQLNSLTLQFEAQPVELIRS